MTLNESYYVGHHSSQNFELYSKRFALLSLSSDALNKRTLHDIGAEKFRCWFKNYKWQYIPNYDVIDYFTALDNFLSRWQIS